jgi:hypothetical protein
MEGASIFSPDDHLPPTNSKNSGEEIDLNPSVLYGEYGLAAGNCQDASGSMTNNVVIIGSFIKEREGKWEDDGRSGRVRFRSFELSGEGSRRGRKPAERRCLSVPVISPLKRYRDASSSPPSRTYEKGREEPDRRSEAVISPFSELIP